MSFIGIITNVKNESYMVKELLKSFKEEQVIFITDNNIKNMKNIRFETIVMDAKLKHIESLKVILSNTKYLILNVDIVLKPDTFDALNLTVISYGFQSKATFTISSVSDSNIIICLQRIMKTINKKRYEPQEFEVESDEGIDIHAIIGLQILLLLYEKIHILVN